MAAVAVAAAAAVVAAAVGHPGVCQRTMTEATTEVMTEVMIGSMIATKTESTGHTGADLHLLTTAEGTALDPDPDPTLHVTTEQQEECYIQSYCLDVLFFLTIFCI